MNKAVSLAHWRSGWLIVASVVGLCIVAASTNATYFGSRYVGANNTIAVWQTSPMGLPVTRMQDIPSTQQTAASSLPVITVDDTRRYQRIVGFGGAFNERGWQALLALQPAARLAVVRALFDPHHGAGFSLARAPIGASDYALNAYSLDDVSGDTALNKFSIDRDQKLLLPYVRAALAVAPNLTVWSSPWSAPAWMKTNNSMLHGGSLRPADEPVYAQYLGEYVRAYAAAGVPISAISVQNEPSQATSYPSMVMTSGQMAHFVGHFLGPLLQRVSPHTAIRINEEPSRDRWRYSLPVLADPLARPYIAGTDLHGYHGQSSDFTHLHQIAPRLDIWQTEVIHLDHPHYEYSDAITWASSIASDMQNWTAGWDFWNMVTDQTGLSSWGWRQDAVVIVDTHAHSVLYTPKYFALAHFSRFIRPGAHRIAADGVPPGLVACASRNPDGRIVLVVVNTRGIRSNFAISFKGGRFTTTIPGLGIATFVWR